MKEKREGKPTVTANVHMWLQGTYSWRRWQCHQE